MWAAGTNFPAVAPSRGPTLSAILFTFSLTTRRGWTVFSLLQNVALDSKEVQQTVSKRVWSTTASGPGEKVRGWTILCCSRQRLNSKSHCWGDYEISFPKPSELKCVRQKWPYASLREGEGCYACALLVSLSVCAVDGCVGRAGSSPTKSFHFHQLQGISHTSSIFFQQYYSTVALSVYFPDFN